MSHIIGGRQSSEIENSIFRFLSERFADSSRLSRLSSLQRKLADSRTDNLVYNNMSNVRNLIIFVDVDDTFVRTFSRKRMPIPGTIEHLKKLKSEGTILYCWSSGGAEYARESAKEFGIEDLFESFLPKPQVLIDDQSVEDWRNLLQVHPNECSDMDSAKYRERIYGASL